jgi:hypothetical protein
MKNKPYLLLAVIAFLCMALWTVYGQGQKSNPTRQAWEYKSLVLTIDGSKTSLYEDGKQLPGSPTPTSKAPELGAQGWELVSVAGTAETFQTRGNVITYVYWFKRPK